MDTHLGQPPFPNRLSNMHATQTSLANTLLCLYLLVPSGPPLDIRAVSPSPTSLLLEWRQPSEEETSQDTQCKWSTEAPFTKGPAILNNMEGHIYEKIDATMPQMPMSRDYRVHVVNSSVKVEQESVSVSATNRDTPATSPPRSGTSS